jgi:hypothetical protein
MADGKTANYEFIKPEIGASNNTWGNKLNGNMDSLDSLLATFDVYKAAAKTVPVMADKLTILDTEADPVNVKTITIDQLKALINTVLSFPDNTFELFDNVDPTKKLKLQLSGITTASTRTLTAPDTDGTIVLVGATQTLENKTLVQPTLTLRQGDTEAPTAEGDIRWDTDDNYIVVGDGENTRVFIAVPSGIAENDLLLVNAGAKSFKRLPKGTLGHFLRSGENQVPTWTEPEVTVYTGTSNGNLNFPIGTVLMADIHTLFNRNASVTLYLQNGIFVGFYS